MPFLRFDSLQTSSSLVSCRFASCVAKPSSSAYSRSAGIAHFQSRREHKSPGVFCTSRKGHHGKEYKSSTQGNKALCGVLSRVAQLGILKTFNVWYGTFIVQFNGRYQRRNTPADLFADLQGGPQRTTMSHEALVDHEALFDLATCERKECRAHLPPAHIFGDIKPQKRLG